MKKLFLRLWTDDEFALRGVRYVALSSALFIVAGGLDLFEPGANWRGALPKVLASFVGASPFALGAGARKPS